MKDILALNGNALDDEIQKIIRENPPVKKLWTQKEREIAFRLRKAGVPSKVIAQKLGRTINSVHNLFSR